jgi:hypothetical protein
MRWVEMEFRKKNEHENERVRALREYIGARESYHQCLDGAERRIKIERLRRVEWKGASQRRVALYPRGSGRKGSIRCGCALPYHYQLAAEAVVAQVKRLAIPTSRARNMVRSL